MTQVPLSLYYVDDDPGDLKALAELAKRLRNPITLCRTPSCLYEKFDSIAGTEKVQGVILVDMMLENASGAELIRELRRKYSNLDLVPMIIVTGSRDPASMKLAEMRGADAYIIKPISLDSLMVALSVIGDYKLEIVDLREMDGASAA